MSKKIMVPIPSDVPRHKQDDFVANYNKVIKKSENIFLFACDHKIEHLNSVEPKKLFAIASDGSVGALTTHLGLIARYGTQFPDIPYIVKLNGKTNIIPQTQHDPISRLLYTVEDVVLLQQQSALSLCGIAITIYLGSRYEDIMLNQAAQAIYQAHQHGLLALVWMYPRGQAIQDELDPKILIGGAGIANALGADFVKIKTPTLQGDELKQFLHLAHSAAGNTRIIISGGPATNRGQFLDMVRFYMQTNSIAGCAIGRNIFEHPLDEAIDLSKKIAEIIYNDQS